MGRRGVDCWRNRAGARCVGRLGRSERWEKEEDIKEHDWPFDFFSVEGGHTKVTETYFAESGCRGISMIRKVH